MQKFRNMAFIIAVMYFLMLFPVLPVLASTEDRENGYDDGYSSGYTDGISAALEDLGNDSKKNANSSMPSYSEIVENYDLDSQNSDYKSGFTTGYRNGFREGYNYGYDNVEAKETVKFDEDLGYAMGVFYGKLDYYAGKKSNWGSPAPTTTEMIEMFGLNNEPKAFKDDFLVNFKTKFKEGYEYGYRTAKFEPYTLTMEKGTEDGEELGGILGTNNGKRDYYNGMESSWERDMPSDQEIEDIFLLGADTKYYRDSFVGTFKLAYRTKYEEAYRKANIEKSSKLYEDGYNNGREIGMQKGESLATADRIMNISSNENRYSVNDSSISTEYMLYNENQKYREGFISGFQSGIREGYTTGYQQYSYLANIKKTAATMVTISGLEVKSGDGRLKLNVAKGTYYNDIVVTIDSYQDGNIRIPLPASGKFTKASGIYSVTINNYSGVVNRDKTMKLSFDYYGPVNAGIYMYTDGGWLYMPSKMDEKGIITHIMPKTLGKSTAIYGVFIDESARNASDLRGHWAKDEIVTYLRRGILAYPADNYFRPDAALSYNQAVAWLNRVWSSKLNGLGLKDRPLTYTEMEKLFRQASGKTDFTWSFIAEKMAANKDKRSGSYSSMSGYVTRAEAVYAMYYMKE